MNCYLKFLKYNTITFDITYVNCMLIYMIEYIMILITHYLFLDIKYSNMP